MRAQAADSLRVPGPRVGDFSRPVFRPPVRVEAVGLDLGVGRPADSRLTGDDQDEGLLVEGVEEYRTCRRHRGGPGNAVHQGDLAESVSFDQVVDDGAVPFTSRVPWATA